MPQVFKHLYFKMALDFAKTGNIGATALNFLSNAGFKKIGNLSLDMKIALSPKHDSKIIEEELT